MDQIGVYCIRVGENLMANTLKHKFVSAVPDRPDASRVRGSNWNDEHLFAGGSPGFALVWDDAASDKVKWEDRFAGRAGGQTLIGGTNAAETLTLKGTSHATPGNLLLNPSGGIVRLGLSTEKYLEVASAGQLGIWATPDVRYQIIVGGTFNQGSGVTTAKLRMAGTLNPLAGSDAHNLLLTALTINKAGSGTHALFSALTIDAPTIGAGGGAGVTTASSLQISGAPSGATNNYSLNVHAGMTRLGGNVTIGALGTTLGTNAALVLGLKGGTAPVTAPADLVQLWEGDIGAAAGKGSLLMMSESGTGVQTVVGVLIKTDTGDPAQVHEGLMQINTFDNKIKMYAEGAWRQLATR